MTAGAISCNVIMVKFGCYPTFGRVAIFTIVRALDMIGGFSFGDGTVMTAGTGPVDGIMINLARRLPGACAMAIFTGITSIDVIVRFACGHSPVMTAKT